MTTAAGAQGSTSLPRLAGLDNVLVTGATGARTRWHELPALPLEVPTAALVGSTAEAFAWVAAHLRTRTELLLAGASRVPEDLRRDLLSEGLTIHVGGSTTPAPPRPSETDRLWLLTSGSTGRPKRVGHTLASLSTVTGAQPPQRWLCPYPPGSYAWWQLVTLAVGHPGQDLVAVDPAELDTWPQVAAEHGVTAVSGTPTFWRRTLLASADELSRLSLRQVTLGGEPVDQAILDQLRELFPQARVSWIYASSELGASIVVHDGQAGFPRSWLGVAGAGRVGIEVDGEELVLRSPHHAAGLDGAVRTGDRVSLVGDRVHVVGRLDSDEINVGGLKASAGGVREVVLGHPRVRWARVFGRRAPLVGAVVAAEVVLDAPVAADEQEAVTSELSRWCAQRLPEAAVPRRWRVLESVPVKESLKSDVG